MTSAAQITPASSSAVSAANPLVADLLAMIGGATIQVKGIGNAASTPLFSAILDEQSQELPVRDSNISSDAKSSRESEDSDNIDSIYLLSVAPQSLQQVTPLLNKVLSLPNSGDPIPTSKDDSDSTARTDENTVEITVARLTTASQIPVSILASQPDASPREAYRPQLKSGRDDAANPSGLMAVMQVANPDPRIRDSQETPNESSVLLDSNNGSDELRTDFSSSPVTPRQADATLKAKVFLLQHPETDSRESTQPQLKSMGDDATAPVDLQTLTAAMQVMNPDPRISISQESSNDSSALLKSKSGAGSASISIESDEPRTEFSNSPASPARGVIAFEAKLTPVNSNSPIVNSAQPLQTEQDPTPNAPIVLPTSKPLATFGQLSIESAGSKPELTSSISAQDESTADPKLQPLELKSDSATAAPQIEQFSGKQNSNSFLNSSRGEADLPSAQSKSDPKIAKLFQTEQVSIPSPSTNSPHVESEPAPAQQPAAQTTASKMQEVIETSSSSPSSNHSINVKVSSGTDDAPIDLRFLDRGGQVHVSVRTPDASVAQELRGGLNDLVGRLEHAGIRTEISTASTTGSGTQPESHDASQERRNSSWNQPDSQDEQQSSRNSRQTRWMEMFSNAAGEQTPANTSVLEQTI